MLSDNAQPDYGGESVVRWMKLLENFFLGGGQLSKQILVILQNYKALQKCLNSFEIASNCLTINKKFSLLILMSNLPGQLLDRCADGMAFGALKRCSECARGYFAYK